MTKSIQERFCNAAQRLNGVMIGRESEVNLCLTAMAVGEHVLMVAPPGTGKSMLADQLGDLIDGKVFRIQLNKTTEIDELVGPMDLAKFKMGEYRRRPDGKLPESSVAILDEVFKGSSAILNATLSIMQEGRWFDGTAFVDSPVWTVIGTSNEFPDPQNGGRELAAMFDRFLFRTVCQEVRDPALVRRLMFDKIESVEWADDERISGDELGDASVDILSHPASPEVPEVMLSLIRDLERDGVRPGDRRRRKAVWAVQAASWVRGGSQVELEDLEILQHVLWTSPEQREKVAEAVMRIVDPDGGKSLTLAAEIEDLLSKAANGKQNDNGWHLGLIAKIKVNLQELSKIHSPRAKQLSDAMHASYADYHSWFVRERL